MKVKIIANPDVHGGGMVLVNDEMLSGVKSVDIHLDADANNSPRAVITLIDFDADIECDAEVVKEK